jgi:succinate dehydrogenase/fumarate reductase flavoprotein subunit
VDVTPEELERAAFESVDGRLDPDAVRRMLRRAAERIRMLEREGVKGVANSVGAILEQAMTSADAIIAAAKSDADAIRSAADADAARRTEAAAAEVDAIIAAAEQSAREHSIQVISDAQARLDRLLAAEREVHDRLHAAMTDLQSSVSRLGGSQSAELALTIDEPDLDMVATGSSAPGHIGRMS